MRHSAATILLNHVGKGLGKSRSSFAAKHPHHKLQRTDQASSVTGGGTYAERHAEGMRVLISESSRWRNGFSRSASYGVPLRA